MKDSRNTPVTRADQAAVLVLAPQPFFQERGTPIAVRLLVEELASAGYPIDLLTFHEGKPFEFPGVHLKRTPALPGIKGIMPGFSFKKIICDALMLVKSFWLIHKKKYRLVHAVEESVFIALLLSSVFDLPFVYDMDSLLSLQLAEKFSALRLLLGLTRRLEHLAIRKSRGVVAVCEELAAVARKAAPNVPTVVLEDIDLTQKTDRPEKPDDIRSSYQVSGPLFMYVGNLEQYQGIGLLLSAFSRLSDTLRAKTRLVIIGGAARDIATYRNQANTLGINEQVYFLGPKPVRFLGYYLNQADILISPRIQGNNTPMKIYSYLGSGKPVIATRLSTHLQVLDDEIALLCEPEPKAMAAAMTRLAGDEELGRRLGEAGRKRVQECYSRESYRKRLTAFYAKILGPPA